MSMRIRPSRAQILSRVASEIRLMDSRARRIGHLHEGSQLFDIDIGQRQTDADGAASSFDPSGGRMRCERTLRFIRPHEELGRFILGEG